MRNQKGVSLVEVTLAGAMLVGLGVYLMQMTTNQQKIQKRTETNFEIISLQDRVNQLLLNADACESTLGGVNTLIRNGMNLASIRNRENQQVFRRGETYSNGQVKINAITLSDFSVPSGVESYTEASITMTLEKTSPIITGAKTVTKRFPISLGVNNTSRLIKCHSSTENAVSTAKKEACENIGGPGAYNSTTQSCNLNNFIANELDSRYIQTNGSGTQRINGDLIVSGQITSNGTKCVGSNCTTSTTAPKKCPTNQIMTGIKANGDPICATNNATSGCTKMRVKNTTLSGRYRGKVMTKYYITCNGTEYLINEMCTARCSSDNRG